MASCSVDMSFFAPLNLSITAHSTPVVGGSVPASELNDSRKISFADETNLPLEQEFEFDADSVHSESSFEDWVTFIPAGDPDDDCSWFTEDDSLEEASTTGELSACEDEMQPEHAEEAILVFDVSTECEPQAPPPPSSVANQGLASVTSDSKTEEGIMPREKKSHKQNEESWKKKLEEMVIDEYAEMSVLPIKEQVAYERPEGFLGNSAPKVEQHKVKLRTSWLKNNNDGRDEVHTVPTSEIEVLKEKSAISQSELQNEQQQEKLQLPSATESSPKFGRSSLSKLAITDLCLAARPQLQEKKAPITRSSSCIFLDSVAEARKSMRKVASSRALKGCDFMSASSPSMPPELEKVPPKQTRRSSASSLTALFEAKSQPTPPKEPSRKVVRMSSLPASSFEAFLGTSEKDLQQPTRTVKVGDAALNVSERRMQFRKLTQKDSPEADAISLSSIPDPSFRAVVGSKSLAQLATLRASSDRSSKLENGTSRSKREAFAGKRPMSLRDSGSLVEKRAQELFGKETSSRFAKTRAVFSQMSSGPFLFGGAKRIGSSRRRSVDSIEEER